MLGVGIFYVYAIGVGIVLGRWNGNDCGGVVGKAVGGFWVKWEKPDSLYTLSTQCYRL